MQPTVKIGNIVYQVEITQQQLCVDNHEVQALVNYNEARIVIRTDGFARHVQDENWWHEVLHGIIKSRNLTFGEGEEAIVVDISRGLHALMMDNPFPLPGQESLEEGEPC